MMLKTFLEQYGIPIATLSKIRRRVMIVGRFSSRPIVEGEAPSVYLFSNDKPSKEYRENFGENRIGKLRYDEFVSLLQPKWSETEIEGQFLTWVVQEVPKAGKEGKVLVDANNLDFLRAIVNTKQRAFSKEKPSISLKDESQDGRIVFWHVRECLKRIAIFQARSFDLVNVFAHLMEKATDTGQIPMTYRHGREFPQGLYETLMDYLLAENRDSLVDLERVDFTKGLWREFKNKQVMIDLIALYRAYLLNGNTDGHDAVKVKGGTPDHVLDLLLENRKDLISDYRDCLVALNSLRQLLRERKQLFRILKWVFDGLYELEPVKKLKGGAKQDVILCKILTSKSDCEGLNIEPPVARPSDVEEAKFRRELLDEFEQLVRSIRTPDLEASDNVKMILAEIPEGSMELLRQLCGKGKDSAQAELSATAFLTANKGILVDLILDTIFQTPGLNQDRLLIQLRVAFETSYLQAVLLTDANKERLLDMAARHIKSLADNLETIVRADSEAGTIVRFRDAALLRRKVLADYLKIIGNESVGKQLLESQAAIQEVLPFLSARSQQTVFSGLQPLLSVPSPEPDTASELAEQIDPYTTELLPEVVELSIQRAKQAAASVAPSDTPRVDTASKTADESTFGSTTRPRSEGFEEATGQKKTEPDQRKPSSEFEKLVDKIVAKALTNTKVALDEIKKSDVPTELSARLKAYRAAIQFVYEQYRANPDKKSYRNVVDRLTLSGLMLGMQEEIGINDKFSHLLQLLLDMVGSLDQNTHDPLEFFRQHSLTTYFPQKLFDAEGGLGITELFNALDSVTRTSSENVVRFVSELRGIKYLFDSLKDAKETELLVVNANATEFFNWIKNDRHLSAGALFTDTKEGTFFPGLIVWADLELSPASFLQKCNSYDFPNGVVLPPICLSTGPTGPGWYAQGKSWASLAEGGNVPVMVVGPSPRLNPESDTYATYLPAAYLVACHFLGGTIEGIGSTDVDQFESDSRFKIIHSDNNRLQDTIEATFWPTPRKTVGRTSDEEIVALEPVDDGAYGLANDYYLLLLSLLWGAARSRVGILAAQLNKAKLFDCFNLSNGTLPEFQSSAVLDPIVYGGIAQRYSLEPRDPRGSTSVTLEVAVGAVPLRLDGAGCTMKSSATGWFVRALQKL